MEPEHESGAAPVLESPPEDPLRDSPDPQASESNVEPEQHSPDETPDEAPEETLEETSPKTAPREVSDEELEQEISALLLASPDPLSTARLRSLTGGAEKARVEAALGALGERMQAAGLPWEIRAIAGGWQLFTSPELADVVAALSKARKEERISPAGLETLAVVAYRQPVTKAEIEAIRGVQVGPILRTLVDRGLVKVAGRAEVPGHPLLYGTTGRFLDAFGLARLDDLPRDSELLKD